MKLSEADWRLLSGLLDQALDLPPQARRPWIDALDGPGEGLKPMLRRLFPPGDAAFADLLDTLPKYGDLAPQTPVEQFAAGALVGPYRLVRELGVGGMGAVWLAERVDGALKRTVALKLLMSGIHDRALAERFARERDILAQLEHPRIARLYDAGVTPEGQPFLALEYVEGTCLTDHCDSAAYEVAARLTLFLQVLDAVQYAHSHLVVHRDLKPSNILVTHDGQSHLLDFGVAKLIGESGGAQTQLTEIGGRPLTPAYASPEQVSGGAITTASDVYSLGVVLYELLTGQRPYKLRRDSRGALEEAILDADVRPPSTACDPTAARHRRATPRQLRKALSGDLDTIVLKAMKKDPANRYQTAQAFAEDLRRHLDGEAVMARPDSVIYRAGKFARRHRVGVAAGVLVGLSFAAGVVGIAWQGQVARAEADRAKAVQEFLVGLFNAADPTKARGRDVSVRELLDRGARDLKDRLDDQPKLKSTLEGVLVELYGKLADERKALPLAEARRDLALRTQGRHSVEYGDALYALARIHGSLGSIELADRTYRDAEAVYRRHPDERAGELLLIPRHRAFHLLQDHRSREARELIQAVLPGIDRFFGRQSWEGVEARELLGASYEADGDHARAAALMGEIAPILDRPPPDHALDAAVVRANVGLNQWRAGEFAVAEQALRRSIADFDHAVGNDSSVAIDIERGLGVVLMDAGKYAEAAAAFDDTARRAIRFYGEHHPEAALNQSFGIESLVMIGRTAQAEAIGRATVADVRGKPGLTPAQILAFRRRLALALIFTGKADEALALLDQIVDAEHAAKDDGERHAMTLLYRAGALEALGRHVEAAAAAREAGARVAGNPVLRAKAEMTMALAVARGARDAGGSGAESIAASAEEHLRSRLQDGHPQFLFARIVRAQAIEAMGRSTEAARLAAAARSGLEAAGVKLPPLLPLVF